MERRVWENRDICVRSIRSRRESLFFNDKRTLVVGEDYVLTGFKEKEWVEKILK